MTSFLRVEIVLQAVERLPHQRSEGVRAVVQRHGQRAQLRFHQQRRRPRREQSFLDDSWHMGVLSPFFQD